MYDTSCTYLLNFIKHMIARRMDGPDRSKKRLESSIHVHRITTQSTSVTFHPVGALAGVRRVTGCGLWGLAHLTAGFGWQSSSRSVARGCIVECFLIGHDLTTVLSI